MTGFDGQCDMQRPGLARTPLPAEAYPAPPLPLPLGAGDGLGYQSEKFVAVRLELGGADPRDP